MKFLREPLLHFLLLGAALFAAYGWLHPGGDTPRRIVVSAAQVETIVAQFQGTWQRPPTEAELRGLVDSWIRDEILYREGEALGLERGDPVVKRRVRQKYEVMSEESLVREPPSEADLARYLEQHADAFRQPPRVSFEQVLVVPSGSDANATSAVAAALAALVAGADPDRVGRPTMLPTGGQDVGLDLIARDFGESFAVELGALQPGSWRGPIKSGFGLHVVRVTARVPGALPPLAEVRSAVEREWESARRQDARETQLRGLRQRYEVVVDADLAAVAAAQLAAQ
jgi:hypothetical protein